MCAAHAAGPFTFDFRGPLDIKGFIAAAGGLGFFVLVEGLQPCDIYAKPSLLCMQQQVPPWLSVS